MSWGRALQSTPVGTEGASSMQDPLFPHALAHARPDPYLQPPHIPHSCPALHAWIPVNAPHDPAPPPAATRIPRSMRDQNPTHPPVSRTPLTPPAAPFAVPSPRGRRAARAWGTGRPPRPRSRGQRGRALQGCPTRVCECRQVLVNGGSVEDGREEGRDLVLPVSISPSPSLSLPLAFPELELLMLT